MNIFARFLTPPVFAEDAEKTHVARLAHTIILAVVSVFGLALVALALTPRARGGVLLLLPLCLWGIGMWLWLRAGYVYGVARGLVLSLWGMVTSAILFTGGVRGPETAGYVLVLMIAGILSGIRIMFLYTGLSLAVLLGLYGIEMGGFLPKPLFPPGPLGGLVLSFITLLLVCVVFSMALASLQRALALAHRNTEELADKNRDLETIRASLEAQVNARTRALEAARLEAEAANAALQEQMWQVLGLAHLGEIQPTEPGVVPRATAVLEYICHYVGAAVGALYLWEDTQLVLTTGYACPVALSHNQRFTLGEGLIGQVAAEGRPHEVTAEAASLTLVSSFGEIALAQVYVYPLLYGGTVLGVLEVGGMAPFTAAQTQFLTQALERFAVIIHTLQAQARINRLLQETQQQSEELQAQEEELRATNEELQAQTEALRANTARAERG